MSTRTPVFTRLERYGAAAAGLPLSSELVDDMAGAVVVVDGNGRWWHGVSAAERAGASAVIIAEPDGTPPATARELIDSIGVPVIVERRRLRRGLADLAIRRRGTGPLRALVAECSAAGAELPALVRDAVGWMRELTGGDLGVVSSAVTATGGSALVRNAAWGVPGSLVITVKRQHGMMLRVQALGEIGTEFDLDEPMGGVSLATITRAGLLMEAEPFEAIEREALRRAVDAVSGAGMPPDLVDLLSDTAIASEILD